MMTLPGYTALALPAMTVNETTSQKQINRNNYRRSYGFNNLNKNSIYQSTENDWTKIKDREDALI